MAPCSPAGRRPRPPHSRRAPPEAQQQLQPIPRWRAAAFRPGQGDRRHWKCSGNGSLRPSAGIQHVSCLLQTSSFAGKAQSRTGPAERRTSTERRTCGLLACRAGAAEAPGDEALSADSVWRWRTTQLRRIIYFSLPALSIPLADPLMSLVDTICIGQVGAHAHSTSFVVPISIVAPPCINQLQLKSVRATTPANKMAAYLLPCTGPGDWGSALARMVLWAACITSAWSGYCKRVDRQISKTHRHA